MTKERLTKESVSSKMKVKTLQEQLRLLRICVETTAEIPFLPEDKKEEQRKVADEAWETFYEYANRRLVNTDKQESK
jgi:hypothetical protein